jgi:L-aminoadipate-semialdehyde dehydrogenase
VAKPRGLVVLRGAGKIAGTVREFMEKELELRVEVPALELLADGVVMGGSAEEGAADVLESTRSLVDTEPGIVLGPDSVATLSFTSGSTGLPKGVKGRHYSLTHFFPWMGTRFDLGEHSKFTMLSGIAHDPIQRDSMCPATRTMMTRRRPAQFSRRSSSAHNCTCRPQTTSVRRAGSPSGWRTAR